MYKRFAVLKDGTKFRLQDVRSVEHTVTSLTKTTIHKLFLDNNDIVFVQGNNISYFLLKPLVKLRLDKVRKS